MFRQCDGARAQNGPIEPTGSLYLWFSVVHLHIQWLVIQCIWINYNDLTATSLESWLIRGIVPKWPFFRLAHYYNLPRIYVVSSVSMVYLCNDIYIVVLGNRNLQSFSRGQVIPDKSERKKLRAADIPRRRQYKGIWCSDNSWNSMRRVRFPASRRFHHRFANFSHVFFRKSLWLPLVLA